MNRSSKSPRMAVRGRSNAPEEVRFTHLDRIVFPEAKITKGDVVEYYAKVADKLLPHLRDRPITVERYPEGIGAKAPRFWQKNTPDYYPDWIKRITLPTEKGTKVSYTLVNDLRTLLYLANQNALTFHVWFSRVSKPDVPDFVLFDIDPHQSTFANAIEVAKELHAILDGEEKVKNFIKTSGKTGLHVLTPWPAKDGGYDKARSWAAGVAQRVADQLPKIATTERSIDKRGSRVYVDAMQNARGKHAVPPYVLRATPEATVSMPLNWKDVTAKLSPEKFDMKTALKLLSKQQGDPLISLTGVAPRKRGG
jgi:bifunctional non-homologous end joining protein LigD